MRTRYMLLDAVRGLAVILMLVFHLAVDLEDFYSLAVGYRQGFWYALNQVIVTIFLLVAGYASGSGLNRKFFQSGLKLLAAALLVSAATYFFDAHSYVRFGILHFLACAMFLTPLFLSLNNVLLLTAAIIFVLLGKYVKTVAADTSLLLAFSVMPQGFYSIDYYPLFPWLSVFVSGIIAGRKIKLPDRKCDNIFLRAFAFTGRHALFIYLVHQPLFLLFLDMFMG